MKKQYSKWALKALKLAEETARKCSHNYIRTRTYTGRTSGCKG